VRAPLRLASSLIALFSALDAAAAPEATVNVTPGDGLERIEIAIPGKLLSMSNLRDGDSAQLVMLLVDPIEPASDDSACNVRRAPRNPRQLWEVRPTSAGAEARPVRLELSPDVAAIHAADLDADGRDELLLVRPTAVSSLSRSSSGEWSAAETTRLDAEAFDGAGGTLEHSALELAHDSRMLTVVGLGSTRFFALNAGAAEQQLTLIAELATPVQHELRRNGLQIVGTRVIRIGNNPVVGDWFASLPQAVGDRRLSALLLAPEAPTADKQRLECWMQLPAAERLIEHTFQMIDGKPRLIVTTMPSDKLNLFGEKRLRVFDLQADRSRLGHPPVFTTETRINLWQPTHFWIRDDDGDGRDDLILGYWKGLNKDRVVLDFYRGNGAGGFAAHPRSTAFDVADAERSFLHFGEDLDGDGATDLLLVSKGKLRWHSGTSPAKRRKSLVVRKPRWTLDLGRGAPETRRQSVGLNMQGMSSSFADPSGRTPAPIDWDGDGQIEIYYASDDVEKQELVLTVIGRRR